MRTAGEAATFPEAVWRAWWEREVGEANVPGLDRQKEGTSVVTDVFTLHLGDCLAGLASVESSSVDAMVTDPPAGIGFMGRDWDSDKGGRVSWIAWMESVMREALRVLKPGAHGVV
jgi:hypothetical protein